MNKLLEKRIPIRRRVSAIVLLTMSIALFAASVTGVFCIRWIKNSSENALRVQLESNLKSIVKQKVVSADARLEHYEKYIEFVTDYIEGMYQNEERMISLGRIYEAPRDSREYALTRGFASEAMKAGDFEDEILYAFMTFIGVALLILLCAIVAINRVASTITRPMEQLGRDMKIITEGNLDYRATVYRNDEIGDITSQMNEMVDRLKFTMSELVSSRQHADAMSELATRDSLTGVRNKTAFDAQVGSLVPPYGLVMIDLNNLKMINDNYGHDKGDMAIRKLAGIICDVFEHSPVFRVGGDEFVVVLKDRDYRDVASHVARFKRMMDVEQSQEPWEHVSAAIGYALFDAKTDAGADAVLKRADMQMYRCKNSMKQG